VMARARWFILAILLIGLTIGFIYLHILTRRAKSESPASAEETARTALRAAALQSKGLNKTITLYFPSDDEGVLLPETRQIAWAADDSDRIHQILLALIEGSYRGLRRPLPASTEIRAAFLMNDGTVYVDLSNNALALFEPGIQSETLAIYCIVNSLAANVPAVKKVKILIQGQEVETLNGHADLGGEYVPDPTRIKQGG